MASIAKPAMSGQSVQADVPQALAETVRLDGIAEDVQHLIAAELFDTSPSSVFALGQSSQTLRQAALPLIYRDIVILKGQKNSTTAKSYKALLDLFRGETGCSIARHVRSIAVKDEVSTEDLMMILNKISECGTLRRLSWETTTHMAQAVLDKMHATWPELELSVCVLHREQAKDAKYRQMDEKLISSPLLKSLTYNVFFQGYQKDEPARSEWPKLTRAIAAGGNLRVLRIQSQQDGNEYYGIRVLNDTEPKKLMRLDITPETRLPALEELTLHEVRHYGSSTYLWDTEHCNMLREAMDWSKLRRLNFTSDMPTDFFSTFTAALPELKSLRFGIPYGSKDDVVSTFIKSVKALESLDIDQPIAAIDILWPAIKKQRKTLKTLVLRANLGSWDHPEYLEFSRLSEVAAKFPSLKRLGWDVPWNSRAKYLELISNMQLEKLDLFLHLPDAANDYSARLTQDAMGTRPAPPFDKEGSRKAAIKIMEDLSKAQLRPLERLTLHIARTGRLDRWQPYMMWANLQVRRCKGEGKVSDDAYAFRGKQEWSGMGDLEEELSLEEDCESSTLLRLPV